MIHADRRAREPADLDALELASALCEASGTVPYDDVDWEAFHRRLAACAELPLARLRYPRATVAAVHTRMVPIRRAPTRVSRPWWEPAVRWSRLTVSSALAASVGLVSVIRLTPKDAVDASSGAVVATADEVDGRRAAFESAVVGRTRASGSDSILMPSATELLIPLGAEGASR